MFRTGHIARTVALLLFAGVTDRAAGQAPESLLSVPEPLARFESAVALGAVPTGHLFVLDSGAGTITRLDSTGRKLAVWGGSGSGSYAFDQPSDLDPTNGLMLYVADTGNRVIKRYSGEFLHLESISVDVSTSRAGFQGGDDPFRTEAEGRPLAVRASFDGELFAVDEERAVVVKWTTARRVERIIGGYDAGDGALVRPIALALGPDGALYVADPGQEAVVVFDRFGNFRRTMAEGLARGVRRVVARGNRVLVVLAERLLVYDAASGLVRTYRFEAGEPLQDVAVANGRLYLLTATRLFAVAP